MDPPSNNLATAIAALVVAASAVVTALRPGLRTVLVFIGAHETVMKLLELF
jgi:hypothetical protein